MGTFRLFLNMNSARQSTGSFGKECSSSAMPSDKMGTRLTSRYLRRASDFLSRIYLSSFCSFSFFIM